MASAVAEPVGGVAYTPSPIYKPDARISLKLHGWREAYEAATPGVEAYGEVSISLADQAESPPDGGRIIRPRQSPEAALEGGARERVPELVVWRASSSVSYDFHNPEALTKLDARGIRAALKRDLAAAEHEQFVRWLEEQARS